MNGNPLITRRQALLGGLASVAGVLLPGRGRELPPTYGNLLRMGDNLTYAAHRALLPGQRLTREYSHKDISSFPATRTTDPGDPGQPGTSESYRKLRAGGFADWRLSIEGHVARSATFSLADLERLPSRTQVTKLMCEEGWSAVAEWTGVPLGRVLDAVGILPTARYVMAYSFDDRADAIDLVNAFHPQTLLAYGMNDRDLRVAHGAPVRLRLEMQLGYKSMKYLQRLVVTDRFDDGGRNGSIQNGWAWYAGIRGAASRLRERREARLRSANGTPARQPSLESFERWE